VLGGDANGGTWQARTSGGGISRDLREYGAVGDYQTDDTVPVHRAFADAQQTGEDLVAPPGRYRIMEPIPVTTPINVRGFGDTSVLVAGRHMPDVLHVTIPQRGLFTDLKFDGNDLADRCITQIVEKEDSVGTRWVRCKFTGARDTQMVNHGCEDVTYFDCATDGNEDHTASIRNALSVHVPNGAVRIIGGEWFGRCTFNFQQIAITDATIGPLFIDNPEGRSDSLLFAQGSYIYDGGVHGDVCINTETNLSNIHVTGCYFVAQAQDSYLNGHLPSIFIRVQDCIFVQPKSVSDDTTSYILTGSGDGQLVIDGGQAALRPSGALHAFRPVGKTTVQTTVPVPCLGLT
jgi:hypothetical protein